MQETKLAKMVILVNVRNAEMNKQKNGKKTKKNIYPNTTKCIVKKIRARYNPTIRKPMKKKKRTRRKEGRNILISSKIPLIKMVVKY